MFDSLGDILRETVEIVRPPERLTVAEAAQKYRRVYAPGAYVGPWRNELTPYMVEPQEVLTSTDFTAEVFVGPARTGKSDTFFNWLLHTALCDPNDMMRLDMTQATSRDWSQGDLSRFFRKNPLVEAKLGVGRQNRNVHDLHFINGFRLLVKWPSITELSGKTMPRVWLADYDRMEGADDVDGEGPAFDLARKRTATYRRWGMTVAESSPGRLVTDPKWIKKTPHEAPPTSGEDNAGGILALYNRGDRRRWYWQCPDCRETYEPDFHMLRWPETEDVFEAAQQAILECPHCGYGISHDPDEHEGTPGKFQMNLNGRWVIDGQKWIPDDFDMDAVVCREPGGEIVGVPCRSTIASFWLKGPPAGLTDWETLVTNYLKAKQAFDENGSEEALKNVYGLDLGLPYTPKSLQSDRLPEALKSRAHDFGTKDRPMVPRGTRFIVSTVDVQKNRFVVQSHGIGEGGDIYVIWRHDIRKSARLDPEGDPYWVSPGSYPEDWRLLVDQVIKKDFALSDGSGRRMRTKLVLCDSGGETGVATQALNFWRWLRLGPPADADDQGWEPGLQNRFNLLRGTGNRAVPRVTLTYPDAHRKDRHSGARGDVPLLRASSSQSRKTKFATRSATAFLEARMYLCVSPMPARADE